MIVFAVPYPKIYRVETYQLIITVYPLSFQSGNQVVQTIPNQTELRRGENQFPLFDCTRVFKAAHIVLDYYLSLNGEGCSLQNTHSHLDKQSTNMNRSPIENCPTEVLQCFFEWSSIKDDKPIGSDHRMVQTFSQVCRLWRVTAIHTPTLWSYLKLNLNRSREALDSYWNQYLKRAKDVALTVKIQLGRGSIHDSLPRNFTRVKRLHYLEFDFGLGISFSIQEAVANSASTTNRFNEFMSLNFPLPTCPIGELMVFCTAPVLHFAPWELDTWLARWPAISQFSILGSANVVFGNRNPLRSIKRIYIDLSKSVHLDEIMKAFPNASSIELLNVVLPQSGKTLQSGSLKTLDIESQMDVIWRSIVCPALTAVSILSKSVPVSFLHFLKIHTSITTLNMSQADVKDINTLRRIALLAPQLKRLHTTGTNMLQLLARSNDFGLVQPAFPYLEEIVIWGRQLVPISIFESLVRARCLPALHPESLRASGISKQIRKLTIDSSKDQKPDWLSSPLRKWSDLTTYGNETYELVWAEKY